AGLTAVPDYFACYFNNLTAVDLSGLSGVTSFRDGFLAGCFRLNSLDLTPLSGASFGRYFLSYCGGPYRGSEHGDYYG
ncbi:MAG: hypothetical protein LBG84_09750, partial [Treponema sp.]|nr:hypothetical protein [Treponema sp.]